MSLPNKGSEKKQKTVDSEKQSKMVTNKMSNQFRKTEQAKKAIFEDGRASWWEQVLWKQRISSITCAFPKNTNTYSSTR